MDENTLIEVQSLFAMAHAHGLRELSITQPGFSVSVVSMEPGVVPVAHAPAHLPHVAAVVAPSHPEIETPAKGEVIPSPLVGLFYRSPSPDSPAFVEIGDTVEVGQTVCIIEAMKVFNEITTEVAGAVIAIPAENGKLVQVDQPLVIIEPFR